MLNQKSCQLEMPRASMIICALRHPVVRTTAQQTAFKSSGPAWTRKVQRYGGWTTVACMLMQLTKKNGYVPLLQMLMRTRRLCITEEPVTLEKHTKQFVQDASRPSDASCDGCPTKIDRYVLMDVRVSVRGGNPGRGGVSTPAMPVNHKTQRSFGRLSTKLCTR